MLAATVLIPTFDHGPTLLRSVTTALNQTVTEIEVLIIGDGVPDGTRDVVRTLCADPRVRFFDHPKGPRHGERHRHAALAEAQGEIVCYLSDDDLWLPTHVEQMRSLLRDADFAHSLPVSVLPDGSMASLTVDLALDTYREIMLGGHNRVPLSCAAHTLALYRRQPYGWRTTPTGTPSDLYMWQQILAEPGCRAVSGTRPTALSFPSPLRPSETIEERCAELDRFMARLGDPALVAEVYDAVVRDRAGQHATWRNIAEGHAAWGRASAAQVEERNTVIRELQRELDERTAWAQRLAAEVEARGGVMHDLQRQLDERTAWAQRLAAEVEARGGVMYDLQRQLDERTAWAQRAAADVDAHAATIRELQRELEERTAWAQRAAAEVDALTAALREFQAAPGVAAPSSSDPS